MNKGRCKYRTKDIAVLYALLNNKLYAEPLNVHDAAFWIGDIERRILLRQVK